jgi:hypothetical protein
MNSSTTAIIVSYKSKWIIENCIKSIEKKYKIIVIDNSKDYELKKILEKKYKNLKVIVNNNNNGFGNAANIGALKAKTKYILFIGPDTLLENRAITNITKIAKNFNDSFGAILPSEFKNRVNTISEIKKNRGAALIFMKKDIFLRVGLFDESFFLYYEDSDLLERLLKIKQNFSKQEETNLTDICHITTCDGKIKNNTCIKCTVKYCDFCSEIEITGHSCNQEILLSKNFINSMSIQCPNCKLPIEKSSGCSYLTCAACNTKFDHNTKKITNYGGHSTSVDIKQKEKVSNIIIAKFNDISKECIQKIQNLENYDLKYNVKMLKSIKDNTDTTIKYYEKYLKQQKKYKENIVLLEKIKECQNTEQIYKFLSII